MKKIFLLSGLLSLLILNSVHANEKWTEIGMYMFLTDIKGDTRIGNVVSDVDVPVSDVLDELDMAFMAFVEHRNGKWSFIGDIFYANIGAKDTIARNNVTAVSVDVDVELKQLMLEGFVAYRVVDKRDGITRFGVDLLGGLRYNKIETELGVQVSALGLTTAGSRNGDIDWTDAVVGVRTQYSFGNGWGLSGWADIGDGQDSSSYQLIGLVNYTFKNKARVFGGYRKYNMEYEDNSIALDLDYQGPILGVSFRF